jgi:hypothetical protein
MRIARMPSIHFARAVSVLLVACASTTLGGCGPKPKVVAPTEEAKALTPAQIAKRATPAIVTIRAPEAMGTGFVVDERGVVATSLHVVAGATELMVVLPDKTEHEVTRVLGIDEEHDLVLLEIPTGKKLPTLSLGDSKSVHPGDPVVAIGHPLGLEDTVSNGLVSAIREVDPTFTVLQISAPIAPGSSGGPLLDEHGDVIGIAAAVITEGQNLNLAIPVQYLKVLIANQNPIAMSELANAVHGEEDPHSDLPSVPRHIPHHELTLLQGCKDADLEVLGTVMEGAIEVGAPLYNSGNFAGCYHVYEGAALDAERKLGVSCRGPKKALGEGRKQAATLQDPAAQAWALRDAFDGVFDVIDRKLNKKPKKK